jgi:hypothetical protein
MDGLQGKTVRRGLDYVSMDIDIQKECNKTRSLKYFAKRYEKK